MVFRNTCDRHDVGCQKDIEGSTFLLIRHILFFVGIFYNMILYVGESLTKVQDGNKIQPRKKAINWKSFKSITNNATVKKVWNIVKCITVGLFCFAAPIIRACYQFANNDKAKNEKDIRSWSPVSLVKAPSRTKGSRIVNTGCYEFKLWFKYPADWAWYDIVMLVVSLVPPVIAVFYLVRMGVRKLWNSITVAWKPWFTRKQRVWTYQTAPKLRNRKNKVWSTFTTTKK